MTHVLRSWDPEVKEKDEKLNNPPDGLLPKLEKESILVLARPKGSHTAEYKRPYIWIKRRGFTFTWFTGVVQVDREAVKLSRGAADAVRLEQWLFEQLSAGRRYSKNTLEAAAPGTLTLTQKELRVALGVLMSSGRACMKDLPKEECRGGFKEYIHPVGVPF